MTLQSHPHMKRGVTIFFINLPYWLHRWMMFSTYCFMVGEPRKGNCKKEFGAHPFVDRNVLITDRKILNFQLFLSSISHLIRRFLFWKHYILTVLDWIFIKKKLLFVLTWCSAEIRVKTGHILVFISML
ncbi:hypothetical protein IKE_06355 [Bacillus cereus VD196]|uniref:Uncharacterized protein n=1 Tax=Bacillus cereus VD196 TaxID=1053243 RepID=A0A9W5PXI1_BACCE|nr:hypothetical protein IKE_06355 [Bacillus cereus VD196]